MGPLPCSPSFPFHSPTLGFSASSDGKESASNTGELDSVPGSGRYPGERSSNPLPYSCLENTMERGAWQAIVHGVAEGQT